MKINQVLIFCIAFIGTFAHSQVSGVENCTQLNEILDEPQAVRHLRVSAHYGGLDSCLLESSDFSVFQNIRRLYLNFYYFDSVAQIMVLKSIENAKNLEHLEIYTSNKLSFSAPSSLRYFALSDGFTNNKMVGHLDQVETFIIDLFRSKILPDDPFFQLQNVRELIFDQQVDASKFPFHELSRFDSLRRIELIHTQIDTIPESWSELESLDNLIISSGHSINFMGLTMDDKSKLSIVDLDIYKGIPYLHNSLLNKSGLTLDLQCYSVTKEELRLLKKMTRGIKGRGREMRFHKIKTSESSWLVKIDVRPKTVNPSN